MQNETLFFKGLKRRSEYERNPETGFFYDYSRYRMSIAEDCEFRCVYCDSHEDEVGGREAMELDHFRPWNKTFGTEKEKKFQHLRNEPSNLVHACGVCNGFKWVHWPTENPDLCYDDEKGWIDPFGEVRSDFFSVASDGTVSAKKPPAAYQISKLRLNRPLLKRLREFRLLLGGVDEFEKKMQAVVEHEAGSSHASTAAEILDILRVIRRLCARTDA